MEAPTPLLDPRARRTRKLLLEAALALAAERDFSGITIRDITELVEVNRTTFYLHFQDKDDLITQALDMLFDEFTSLDRAFEAVHYRPSPTSVPPPIIMIFRNVGLRPELYRRLLDVSGSAAFSIRLGEYYEEIYVRNWDRRGVTTIPGSPPPDLRARIASTCVLGLIRWWLASGLTESVETMASWQWEETRHLWFDQIVESGS
ncbi:MAG: TetR/AcrR family transcriptional regulator [Thermomicrobiales bacterium]